MASTFGKAFSREIGKNLGKAASNLIFGDSWSTPYRRVDPSLRERREARAALDRARTEQIEADRRMQEERLRLEQVALQSEIEIKRQQQLAALDSSVQSSINTILSSRIPSDKNGLVEELRVLSARMKATRFERGKSEETKIKNKEVEVLIERFRQCLEELMFVSPDDRHIPDFGKNLVKKQTEIKRKKGLSHLGTAALIVFYIVFIGGIICFSFAEESEAVAQISFAIIAVAIAVLLVWLIVLPITIAVSRAKGQKKYSVKEELKNGTSPEEAKHIEPQKTEQIIDEEEDVFFDLNPGNRIGKTLARIWSKYNGVVDAQLLERRPIFAADGVEDAILFVGVNPSYDARDDKRFIENEDGQSLLYGSFFGRKDSPAYFMNLERFAAQCGKRYAHMNLLYARENDRDYLLKTSPDFIREQLELTYETIVLLKPVAIVFFTTYCRNLIFGADRWVDPMLFFDGHYTLRGTTIPVFFSEDVNGMDTRSRNALASEIIRD